MNLSRSCLTFRFPSELLVPNRKNATDRTHGTGNNVTRDPQYPRNNVTAIRVTQYAGGQDVIMFPVSQELPKQMIVEVDLSGLQKGQNPILGNLNFLI